MEEQDILEGWPKFVTSTNRLTRGCSQQIMGHSKFQNPYFSRPGDYAERDLTLDYKNEAR